MTENKIFIINGEVFENLSDTVYQGWGNYYPTVEQCIKLGWKVGITSPANLQNIHDEWKYTANLGVIDPLCDWYTDIDIGVTKAEIINERKVEYISL